MQPLPDSVMISVATAVFVGGSVWGLAWWLSGQFSSIRTLVYETAEKTASTILGKLEYHEKHDDVRFEEVKRDIWELRLKQISRQTKENKDK